MAVEGKAKEPLFIGITGGIACGKTLVYNMFIELGACGISADDICRRLTRRDGEAFSEIVSFFGKDIVDGDNKLDRKSLGRIIFSDPLKREALNNILHPRVERDILLWKDKIIREKCCKLAIIEIPLLFETGSYSWLDGILVVWSERSTSLKRMELRDGVWGDYCIKRYDSQIPIEEKKNCQIGLFATREQLVN